MNVEVMLFAQAPTLVLEVFTVTQLPSQGPYQPEAFAESESQLFSQQRELLRHDLIASALAQQLGMHAYYPVPPSRVVDALKLNKQQSHLYEQQSQGVPPPQDSTLTDPESMGSPCFCFQVDRYAIPHRVLKELNSMRAARCQGMLEWQTWHMEARATYLKDMEREREIKRSHGGGSDNVQGKARGRGGSSRARGQAAGSNDFDDDDEEEDDEEEGDSEHKAENKGQMRGRAPGFSSPEDAWEDEDDMEEALDCFFWEQIEGMDDNEAAEFCGLLPVQLGGKLVMGVRLV